MHENDVHLLNQILDRIDTLSSKVDTLSLDNERRAEKYNEFAENFRLRTMQISELMSVLNQGKTAAKLIAGLIAVLAGLGATWDWLVAHIRIM